MPHKFIKAKAKTPAVIKTIKPRILVKPKPPTAAQKYAQSKGYPEIPRWAKDLPPAIVEAHKWIIWRGIMLTPTELAFRADSQRKTKERRWLVFQECRLGLVSLGVMLFGTPDKVAAAARKRFPALVGHMRLSEI